MLILFILIFIVLLFTVSITIFLFHRDSKTINDKSLTDNVNVIFDDKE